MASSLRTLGRSLGLASVLTLILVSGAGAAVGAAQAVVYQGYVVDATGAPLDGEHPVTLTYLATTGDKLFAESLDPVSIDRGNLDLELGSGSAVDGFRYPTLEAAFEDHPELSMEVTIADTVYGPHIGILPAGHSLKTRLVAAGLRAADDDEEHWRHYQAPNGATALQAANLVPAQAAKPVVYDPNRRRNPFTLPGIGPQLSVAVRDLPLAQRRPVKEDREINPPRHESLFDKQGNRFGTVAPKQNDFLGGFAPAPGAATPALDFDFEGIDNVNGVLPPDTEGTVGPNHYIQAVNLSFAIYNKSGTLLSGPVNTNTLWSGFGGPCQTDNSGDAIFMYDEQADRFVLSQFAVGGSNQSVCFAVSQTPDPTGSYYLYEYVTPRFPDYYKVGVWPDPANNAYFFGTNSGFQGQYDVFAIDRANMLAGAPVRPMQFFQNFVNLMMPADLDGPPPPNGSPGIFYTFRDGGEPYFSSPPSDSIDVWEFDVDWNTPANSTFTLVDSITPAQGLANFNWTVCGFFQSNCIPQPGTAQGIDSASWWPMQRLVYRNFGSHETLVGTWTVDVLSAGDRAAPRWFELRDTGGGWTIYQQGTHSPDAIHRWMPSVGMDGNGNIAIGYSRGDGSNFPSIYYATRESGDTLGTLQAEAQMFAGTGSQTHSAARWGDYSSMELDPADDCTFWFTTEYLATTGSAPWRTRVGVFSIPGCGAPPTPDFTISCVPASFTINQGSNDTSTCTVNAINGYSGTVNLSCAGEPAGISCGFSPSSVVLPVDGSGNSSLTLTVDPGQATGSYNFDAEGTDGVITKSSGLAVTVTPQGSNGPQNAVYDAGLGAPKCVIAGSSCDSTTLLDSRDSMSPAEPNQPNTLDGCADGTLGSYHNDESNDRIVVSTLDGGNFTEGDTVEIAATVWAWSTGSQDTLDLYYTADAMSPSWTLITSIVPTSGGLHTLTTQYTLPTGSMQAVRAQWRYQSTNAPCSAGNYNDRDDLVFTVEPDVQCTSDAQCDDGAFCNGAETCNLGTGQCEAGTPPACDDGLFCNGAETCNETTDSCDAGTAPACDDGLFCNGAETCNETTDSCDAGTAPSCDDGLFCNGAETCNESTDSCDAGAPPACDDGLFCNGTETCNESTDSCDAGTAPSCDDGLFCNGAETCNETTDSCDAGTPPACDDGLFCNGAETCNESTDSCDAGTPPACDDGAFCNGTETCNESTDSCDAGTPPACDDGLFCNGAETCNETTDSCDAGTPPACDDGAFCNGTETCNEGTDSCDPGTAPCDPGTETCNEGADVCEPIGCTSDAQCNDGLFCNGAETCNLGTGACEAGTPPVCDDGQFCNGVESCNETTDSCDAGTPPACDDGLFCNGAETCNESTDSCDAGAPPVCEDGLFCNGVGTCNEGTDSCDPGVPPACDDGAFCNGTETCNEGTDSCDPGTPPCDPGSETCNEGTDTCEAGATAQLESSTVTVGGSVTTVNLVNSYVSPVVVTSAQYSNNSTPVVTRVSNVTGTSFDVRLQNPSGGAVSSESVTYLVVEEGSWTIDGFAVEAQTYTSTVTDDAPTNWVGEAQTYMQSYTNPVVLGQVMTENDPNFTVFWDQGTARGNPPVAGTLVTGKTVCEDTITARADETVGFIVFEAGHGTIAGVEFEAATGADTVAGVTNSPPYSYTFNTPFASAPTVANVQMAAVDGNNGGWAQTHGTTVATTTSLFLSIDEDQIGDTERSHTTEQVAYAVFAGPVSYPAGPGCTSDLQCDNGLFCDGAETCNLGTGQCEAGTPPACEDGLFCNGVATCNETTDSCDPGGPPACDDGQFCNGTETCNEGTDSCDAGTPPCDPGTETCNETTDICEAVSATMEWGTVSVGAAPVTVNLTGSYASPVVVATVQYDANTAPVVTRINNVTASSFEVRLQNAASGSPVADTVSYLVVEAGVHVVDGVAIEAQLYSSTVTDENNSWIGEARVYGQGYTSPVVLGQVMSENDPDWSVFWDQGSARNTPPSSSALRTGKTVCEDTDTTRANETVGIIVIEAGHGTIGGVEYEAALGADSVRGVTNSPPYSYSFNSAFASAPTVGLATMAGVDGGNGGWAQVHGATMATTTSLFLSIDEDTIGDAERNHTTEQVGYLVFADPGAAQ